jgi:Protein of unknown function (DUF1592)/Protein of unknown function (DUF1588)/Protein of unknown function (DUF1595)/Protein of unknown function (DUF1585)/Protein of unknown function (DUF1587)
MYWDFTTLQRERRGAGRAGTGSGFGQSRLALILAASLAGCVGTVGDSDLSSETGTPGPTGEPGSPGEPGSSPPPVTNVPPPMPTSCKSDQIGMSPLRRLTRLEYDNSVRDLLGVDLNLAKDFSEDEMAGPFPGNYFTPISESQYTQYASAAASAAVKTVERLGQLLPCATNVQASSESACVTQFIRQFGRRAFRRPLDDGDVRRYEELFKVGRSNGDFTSGVGLVVQGMLESPHFIYHVEGPGPLTQHQLAARLSYFLWNAPPDSKLSNLADQGALRTPEALREEAKRMLADPRAQETIDDFHMRWLALEDLETLNKDSVKYPEFEAIHPLMREELKRFTSHVINEGDGKLETLLTAPFTIANGPLAKLYGKTGGGGNDWQKVDLDPSQRAGILTQSAFLATHGHEGSAPIFRGIAVREQLLCVALPPPPPGADANLPEPSPTKTTRDRMEMHRTNPECASCHSLMDVLGYGFESFDDIGRHRTTENGIRVDDSGELIGTDSDGKFKGPIELARKLAGSPQVQQCVTKQWFRYALGRIETDLDSCTLESVYERFKKSDLRLPDLLMALVESDGFRIRRAEESSK